VWVTQWVWVQTNFYCFETPKPKPKPHPQYGEPPFEVLVLDTSRDGRAGGAPLAPRPTAGTWSWSAKVQKAQAGLAMTRMG
jgi:hypothetical protein